jgi:hypothetical protein
MSAVHEYKDFYAICNHEPVGERRIRVGGTVVFAKTGGAAHLEPFKGDIGIVPEPTKLHLTLVLDPADTGGAALDPVPLEEWSMDNPGIEYKTVVFHVDGPGDTPPLRPQNVEHVQ